MSVSFPPTFGAGIVCPKLPFPLQACAGDIVPTKVFSNPPPVVLLLAFDVLQNNPTFNNKKSSQNIVAFAMATGATIAILKPFLFNSASYNGTLNLPFKYVSVKLKFMLVPIGFPFPSFPSHTTELFPAGKSKYSKILSVEPG